MPEPIPVLYSATLTGNHFDPADLFDLAFLLRQPDRYRVAGVLLPDGSDGSRAIDRLAVRTEAANLPYGYGADGFTQMLRDASEPVSVIGVSHFAPLAETLAIDRALFREKVARLFLVGGHVNRYDVPRAVGERIPLDPRLKERHPERFAPTGDPRLSPSEQQALATLLTSGEGVIFLPRDICLWRYAAPHTLADGGPLCEYLLQELFYAHLRDAGWERADRFAAADAPVLLSALPAFLLAAHPDPTTWLRLFRAVTARAETAPETGAVTALAVKHESPNLYAVIGIDGQGLGAMLTKTLRARAIG